MQQQQFLLMQQAQQQSQSHHQMQQHQQLLQLQQAQQRLTQWGSDAIRAAVTEAFTMPGLLLVTLSPQQELLLAQAIVGSFAEGLTWTPPAAASQGPALHEAAVQAIASIVLTVPAEAAVLRVRPFIAGRAALALRGSPGRGIVPCSWDAFLRASGAAAVPHPSAPLQGVVAWSEAVFAAASQTQTPASLPDPSVFGGAHRPTQAQPLPPAGAVVDITSVADDPVLSDEDERAATSADSRPPAAAAGEFSSAGESVFSRFLTELGRNTLTAVGPTAINGSNDRAASTHAELVVLIASASSFPLSSIPFRPGHARHDYAVTRCHPNAYRPIAELTALIGRYTRAYDVITGMQSSLLVNAIRKAVESEGLQWGFEVHSDALVASIRRIGGLPKSAEGMPAFIKRLARIVSEITASIDRKRPTISSVPAPPAGHVSPDNGLAVAFGKALAAVVDAAQALWPKTPYNWLVAQFMYELVYAGAMHTCLHASLRAALEYNARAAGNATRGQPLPEYFNYDNASEGSFNPLSSQPSGSVASAPSAAASATVVPPARQVTFAPVTGTSAAVPERPGGSARKRARGRSPSPAPAALAASSATALLTVATAGAEASPPWFVSHPDTARPENPFCPICGPGPEHVVGVCPRRSAYRASPGSLPIPSSRFWPVGTSYNAATKNAGRSHARR
jgi:hypothetical protein